MMPVAVELQDDNTIMFWSFSDPWSVEDLQGLYGQAEMYLDQAPHTIHLLLDVRTVHYVPPNALKIRNEIRWDHPHIGHVAAVGSSTLVRTLIDILFRLAHWNPARFFDTEADARAYLHTLSVHEARNR